MRRKIIIFGCGTSGQRAFAALRETAAIVGFADNNAQLRGTRVNDLPVFSPADLHAVKYDRLCIASMYHREIREQLVRDARVPSRRIMLAPEFASEAPREPWWLTCELRLRARGMPMSRDGWKLWRMKNSLRGRRAFIIGNGPSLRLEDLELLQRRGELTFASNKIYMAFDRTSWRPSYYAVEDPDSAKRGHEDVKRLINCPMLIRDRYAKYFADMASATYFTLHPPVAPPARPKFSRNLIEGIQSGTTITYALLQWAAWLGIVEAYLLGVDCSYFVDKTFKHQAYKKEMGYRYDPAVQNNYFIKDYHKPGEVLIKPDIEAQRLAYVSAFEQCHQRGVMRIFNATRGGRLEELPRVDFDSLFPAPR